MQWKLLLLFVLASTVCWSQNASSDKFYLADSKTRQSWKLDADLKEQLSNTLKVYHNAQSLNTKLDTLIGFITDCAHDEVVKFYGELGLKLVNEKLNDERLNKRQHREIQERKIEILIPLGGAYANAGQATKGLELLFEAQRNAERINSLEELSNVYVNIGAVFFGQNELTEALKYHLLAKSTSLELGDTTLACYVLNNIGAIYNDLEDYPKSKRALEKSIELSSNIPDKLVLGMALNNLGGVYSRSKQGIDTGIVLLNRALVIFDSLQSDTWMAFTYAKLARIYEDEKDIQAAHEMALSAYEIAVKLNNPELIRRSSDILRRTFGKKGNYELALFHSEKFNAVSDQLRGEESRIEALKVQNEFELEKQKALDKFERESEVASLNAARKQQRIINYALIVGALLLLIFTVVLFYRLRASNRQKNLIAAQNNEKKLLLKEIHHRVKNNFQIISSLLRLEASDKDQALEISFNDAISRIQSMASVHELIYQKEMFADLSAKEYLDSLVLSLKSYSVNQKVDIQGMTDVARLNVKTSIPIGIIINELATNSLKYAFDASIKSPEIKINIAKGANKELLLSYSDNGNGYDNRAKSSGFGTELIETIVEQINGILVQNGTNNSGNQVIIRFSELQV